MGSSPQNPQQVLDALTEALADTDRGLTRERTALVVKHQHFSTRVGVVAPHDDPASEPGALVVHIQTDLPRELVDVIATPARAAAMNRMASLGALMFDNGRLFVGSRLTIRETDNAWNIRGPVVVMSIIAGAESLISASGAALSGRDSGNAESAWQELDFEQIESFASDHCVCSVSASAFTAEFWARPGRCQRDHWELAHRALDG